MDNNKKIIVAVVGLVLAGTLVFALKSIISPSYASSGNGIAEGLEFDAPDLNLSKLDSSSKKELYDESNQYDRDRYDSLGDNLSFLQKLKEKMTKDTEELPSSQFEENSSAEDDLRMLMELQSNLNAANAQYDMGQMQMQQSPPEPEVKKIPKDGDFFFGAASATEGSPAENLIPAETIDQGVFKQGSTIAFRTKESIVLPKHNVRIPKGAVMYGVVMFEGNRLNINVNKYKRDNKLYSLNLDVYDYDGLQGIHLNHRTLFSIPSNVSKDVYRAAIQTYQQQQPILGNGDRREPLDRVAVLSAAKEVAREVFDNRKVFVPRKYHIWLTINQDDNDN
ncbi:conjugative transposon protein TraM [Fulvivirga sediminis]|uniref:Conjugative transposon protein TraM n=1 Tax=Fulvivirga sediminis TaxID=2803949 RepID=A0A937F9Z1_9BACT|nr:conjugative transposon protein TraM [Fulvivirga sediminis]MBL3658415.1 conjugative transposon protein TraM [Fulvivirga sediminis]